MNREDPHCKYSDEYNERQEKYPLKCSCGCNETAEFNEYFDEYGRCEYKLRCKKCGTYLGVWSYGYWDY